MTRLFGSFLTDVAGVPSRQAIVAGAADFPGTGPAGAICAGCANFAGIVNNPRAAHCRLFAQRTGGAIIALPPITPACKSYRPANQPWNERRPEIEHAVDRPDYVEATAQGRRDGMLEALARAGQTFGCILADPPTQFVTRSKAGSGKSEAMHYRSSPTSEICEEGARIRPLAARDSVLFLWSTWPRVALGDHIRIAESWGFSLRTLGFIWVKTNKDGSPFKGCGFFTRANSEPVFIGVKGRPKRLSKNVSQVVLAPRGRHSEKPIEVHRRVEQLFPGPFLELYGRREVPGWTVHGEEIPEELMMGALR